MANRLLVMQWHLVVAALLLPFALLYLLSGLLYTLDVEGKVEKQVIELSLSQPFQPDLILLSGVVVQASQTHHFSLPDSEPTLKKKGKKYRLRWNTLSRSVTLEGKPGSMSAELTLRERSLLTQMMRIHRAEAGSAFKVVSVALVAGLLFLLISGVLLAHSLPRFRKLLYGSLGVGSGVLLVLVFIAY